MDNLPLALITSTDLTRRQMLSALPDAPVVEDAARRPRPPGLPRTRATLARQLHRMADSMTPGQCSPAR